MAQVEHRVGGEALEHVLDSWVKLEGCGVRSLRHSLGQPEDPEAASLPWIFIKLAAPQVLADDVVNGRGVLSHLGKNTE